MSLSATWTAKWFARTMSFLPNVPNPGRAGGVIPLLERGGGGGRCAGPCASDLPAAGAGGAGLSATDNLPMPAAKAAPPPAALAGARGTCAGAEDEAAAGTAGAATTGARGRGAAGRAGTGTTATPPRPRPPPSTFPSGGGGCW
jgi:hypothetical protein